MDWNCRTSLAASWRTVSTSRWFGAAEFVLGDGLAELQLEAV